MVKVCLDLTHSMFNDSCSPSIRHNGETFSHRADDTSFCFAVYPGASFCECGHVVLVLLLSSGFFFFFFGLFWWGGDGLKPQEEKCDICVQYFAFVL